MKLNGYQIISESLKNLKEYNPISFVISKNLSYINKQFYHLKKKIVNVQENDAFHLIQNEIVNITNILYKKHQSILNSKHIPLIEEALMEYWDQYVKGGILNIRR